MTVNFWHLLLISLSWLASLVCHLLLNLLKTATVFWQIRQTRLFHILISTCSGSSGPHFLKFTVGVLEIRSHGSVAPGLQRLKTSFSQSWSRIVDTFFGKCWGLGDTYWFYERTLRKFECGPHLALRPNLGHACHKSQTFYIIFSCPKNSNWIVQKWCKKNHIWC